MTLIGVSADELATVKEILATHIPEVRVSAFGSRVSGSPRKHSDLDLMIMNEVPLEPISLAKLKEAFEESNLPFKVDLLEWAQAKEDFKKIIGDLSPIV